jgi:hypothetical protein
MTASRGTHTPSGTDARSSTSPYWPGRSAPRGLGSARRTRTDRVASSSSGSINTTRPRTRPAGSSLGTKSASDPTLSSPRARSSTLATTHTVDRSASVYAACSGSTLPPGTTPTRVTTPGSAARRAWRSWGCRVRTSTSTSSALIPSSSRPRRAAATTSGRASGQLSAASSSPCARWSSGLETHASTCPRDTRAPV